MASPDLHSLRASLQPLRCEAILKPSPQVETSGQKNRRLSQKNRVCFNLPSVQCPGSSRLLRPSLLLLQSYGIQECNPQITFRASPGGVRSFWPTESAVGQSQKLWHQTPKNGASDTCESSSLKYTDSLGALQGELENSTHFPRSLERFVVNSWISIQFEAQMRLHHHIKLIGPFHRED